MTDISTADERDPRASDRGAKGAKAKRGFVARIGLFFRQVIAELRKVVWPTQQQLVTYFFVVMVFVIFMMALVASLDLGIGKVIFWIFNGRSTS